MTRRQLIVLVMALAAFGLASAAHADQAEEIAAGLAAEGYTNIEIERTLLGRIRITGETEDARREIVIDRGTGEILRDLVERKRSHLNRPGGLA